MRMIENTKNYLKSMGIMFFMCAAILTGCASLNPGSDEDPGEAVGAPTMPEEIQEGYSEGAQYPEESF